MKNSNENKFNNNNINNNDTININDDDNDEFLQLLFIFLLGHDIDFGHMEAVNLLSSNKYSEKQIGYLFISVLLDENNDLMRLIVQSVKNDLCARNPIHVNLALQVTSPATLTTATTQLDEYLNWIDLSFRAVHCQHRLSRDGRNVRERNSKVARERRHSRSGEAECCPLPFEAAPSES